MRARTYDPSAAQFLSVDPAVLITRAPYDYTEDNPLNESDPTGLGNSETSVKVYRAKKRWNTLTMKTTV